MVYGDYQLLLEDHEEVYAYTRTLNGEIILVLLSFSTKKSEIEIDALSCKELQLMISNMPSHAETTKTDLHFKVQPYQCMVYKIVK